MLLVLSRLCSWDESKNLCRIFTLINDGVLCTKHVVSASLCSRKGRKSPKQMCGSGRITCFDDGSPWNFLPFLALQVCLLDEMKPLVFCREVLAEILMLAAVQEHIQSAAFVLHQVRRRCQRLRAREKPQRSCDHQSADRRQGALNEDSLLPPPFFGF